MYRLRLPYSNSIFDHELPGILFHYCIAATKGFYHALNYGLYDQHLTLHHPQLMSLNDGCFP
jgi:hypothetical protein